MAWNIFPTQNNVGTIAGVASRVAGYEPNMNLWLKSLKKSPLDSFVVSGLTLSSPANQAVRIDPGYAIIDGLLVYNDSNVDISGLAFSTTYTIYATLNRDGNNLASSITHNITTGSVPANSVTIGRAVVAASPGAVTVTNAAPSPEKVAGTYTGDGLANRTIWLGFTPKLVIVSSEDGSISTPVTPFYSFSATIIGSAIAGAASRGNSAGQLPVEPSTQDLLRPEIVVNGFEVSGNGAVLTASANSNTRSYRYLAFA